MTYFLEFHTPRGVFTSTPQKEEDCETIYAIFKGLKSPDLQGHLIIPTSAGKAAMTTEIIRQTVLVIRDAE